METQRHMDSNCGWMKLAQKGPIEIWKTPTMYLACYHYLGIFEFTPTLDECKKKAEELYKQNSWKD